MANAAIKQGSPLSEILARLEEHNKAIEDSISLIRNKLSTIHTYYEPSEKEAGKCSNEIPKSAETFVEKINMQLDFLGDSVRLLRTINNHIDSTL